MKLINSRQFNLDLRAPAFEIDRVYTAEGRFYRTPFGFYPSVTTKLSKIFKKDLSAWRERIGEKEADKITQQGANRGTALHNICENYLLGKDWRQGLMPVHLESFLKIKPIIDKNVTNVYGIEFPLLSHEMKTAGATDLLCLYDGVNTVVDFKTARKRKQKKWILDYFIQTVTYAEMANSTFDDLNFTHICIIIAVDGEEPQVFFEKVTPQMFSVTRERMKSTIIEYENNN